MKLRLVLCVVCCAWSVLAESVPRVWMSYQMRNDLDAAMRDCKAHGVDVMDVPCWPEQLRREVLGALRKNGMKGAVSCPEPSLSSSPYRDGKRPHENAVMTGGAYRGKAIDRNLFTFEPKAYDIVVEPPVYSSRQPYTRRVKQADGSTKIIRSGHYFSSMKPTGKAEVVVPERFFDGRSHLRILPCEVLPVETGMKPENDTACPEMADSPEIVGRRLVRLRFDLSDCRDCLLDKVGLAVYWENDELGESWKNGHAELSVFSSGLLQLARRQGVARMEFWPSVNGGVFPTNEIVAIRFGDECFNITGHLNDGSCSMPLWGFSPSGRSAFSDAAGADAVQPRVLGHPEIYGSKAYGVALYTYHRACAELVRAFAEGVHSVAPSVLVYRNTTRGDVWSEANDRDGSGQELLARELDFVHLDPYPIDVTYNEETIPFDMGYMSGFARRFRKPLIPWMQAHSYAPTGLKDVQPDDIDRMFEQHLRFAPDGVMWLGYCNAPGKTDTEMTFPKKSPESWSRAGQRHAAFKSRPTQEKPLARLAVLRPYTVRAVCSLTADGWRNPADRLLCEYVKAWSVDCGRAYDVFEVPPCESVADRAFRDQILKNYAKIVSTMPYPGATVIGLETEGTVLPSTELLKFRRKWAAEFATSDFAVNGSDGAAIQKAIDAAAEAGGGRVVVPAGEYPSASLRLRDHVELHLDKDAVIVGSTNSVDYFDIPIEVTAVRPEKSGKVFLHAWDATDIAITGEGTINGQGPAFFDRSKKFGGGFHWAKPVVPRPRMVEFVNCRNVRLEGVTFKDSPGWTMLLRRCENLRISRVTIDAEQRMINSDGIDVDSCRNVIIENSSLKTGDDCLILRAIREPERDEPAICENILVTNCTLNSTCQTIRMGCPSDDTIRHAVFRDIRAEGLNGIFFDFPVRYLSKGNGGYMSMSDIVFENYCGAFYGSALQIVEEKGVRIRGIHDVTFRDLDVTSAKPLRFVMNDDNRISGVVLENIRVKVEHGSPFLIQPKDVVEVRPCQLE